MPYRAISTLALSAVLAAQTPTKPSNGGWVEILQKGAPAKPSPPVAKPETETPPPPASKPVPNADNERPPLLRRGGGGPGRGRNLPPAAAVEVVSDADGRVVRRTGPSLAHSGDPVIAAARRAVMEFDEKIPNFICDQHTTRFEGEGLRSTRWKKLDRIDAEVLVVRGVESYRNVRRNGKPIREGTPFHSGTWSTGDYHAVQVDVLAPSSDAAFVPGGDGEIGGRKAKKYTYSVKQPNSHWKIEFEGKVLFPAYRGTIWFDVQTNRVLRLDMEAVDVPADFPIGSAAMHVEWGLLPVAGEGFLLPLSSGNWSCRTETAACVRNDSTYANYRRFSAESKLLTSDSKVTFEDRK
jgi:hypothetical protein